MTALVKVNGIPIGTFYQINEFESGTEMHQRILRFIIDEYGLCDIDIQWQN